MKNRRNYILGILLGGASILLMGCVNSLLDQIPTTELGNTEFWQTEEDATNGLMGAYADVRGLFSRDYYFDGQGEYVRVRDGSGSLSNTTTNITQGAAYKGGCYFPDPSYRFGAKFDTYYKFCYGGIHRVNYVIENTLKMIPNAKTEESKKKLETVIGEARLLRGMIYFRLISMWGDVPYIDHVVYNQTEMDKIVRTSIAKIKDYIIEDFNYAFEKLPIKSEQIGRASKPAALAFKGKLELYWACWNHFGWPELDTFTPSEEEAKKAYKAAADDFHAVINNYGLNLFRNGEPGEWGELGDANVLPNYFYLFLPTTGNVNTDGEIIFAFTHGGPGTGQGESLMRDFAGRNIQNSQCWVTPTFRLADRYQSTITGDFTDPLIPMNPNAPNARTTKNSAVNPESYLNRDYRMKASMLWGYEMIQGLASLKKTDWVPFIYKSWNAKVTIDGKQYTSYNTDGTNSGYVFRKFVRNYEGADRGEGDYNWPVIRLADVYLMYAEATNELYGPQEDAIALVNKIRHRGNLPPLASDKISDKKAFFDAIEQERIIELIAEGHRAFDLRRWRAIERVWGEPGSEEVWMGDTHSDKVYSWYKNLNERLYQQAYIFQIPPKERDRNPNLTQNTPWL